MIFLWVFLPTVLIVNYMFSVIPFKSHRTRVTWKNFFLLCASFIFYAWGGIYYLLIMRSSILLNYAGGYIIERGVKKKGAKKFWLGVIVLLNLAILFFFKYFNMLIATIESFTIPGGSLLDITIAIITTAVVGISGLAGVVLPLIGDAFSSLFSGEIGLASLGSLILSEASAFGGDISAVVSAVGEALSSSEYGLAAIWNIFSAEMGIVWQIITSSLSEIGNSIAASAEGYKTIWDTMISMKGTGELGLAEIVLPIGISFFTFQAMSYVIDIYMGKAKLQENLFNFALYVSLFPQLIAGPIVQYADVDLQLRERRETVDLFTSGIKRFCYGLGKKVLIANVMAEVADGVWKMHAESELGAFAAWVGIFAYTLQIYYDFSGYSDMAIGLGRMMGFEFKENFDYPYTSLSVQEFWRRWHISLGSWFREYIYIPLGGNKKGKFRTNLNVFIVFAVTGIWHGANFTFIAWGLFYAILQIIERLFLGKILKKPALKVFAWLYTMGAVMLGWIYFRSDNIFQANDYVGQLFNFGHLNQEIFGLLSITAIVVFIFGVAFSGFIQRPLKSTFEKIHSIPGLKYPVLTVDYLIQFAVLILAIGKLVGGTYNAFIYFQF